MVLPPGVRPAAPALQKAGVPCSGDTEGMQAGATPLYPAQTAGGSCQDSLSTGPSSGAGAIVGFILSPMRHCCPRMVPSYVLALSDIGQPSCQATPATVGQLYLPGTSGS